eukprot:2188112-Amphidinium_carterae.1
MAQLGLLKVHWALASEVTDMPLVPNPDFLRLFVSPLPSPRLAWCGNVIAAVAVVLRACTLLNCVPHQGCPIMDAYFPDHTKATPLHGPCGVNRAFARQVVPPASFLALPVLSGSSLFSLTTTLADTLFGLFRQEDT